MHDLGDNSVRYIVLGAQERFFNLYGLNILESGRESCHRKHISSVKFILR